jgi:multidrug efflux pump subunit AcrA (membrane-fusion protein)
VRRPPESQTPPGGDPTREVALRLPVTDRPSWLILLGLALLVLAGVAWAVFGKTPDVVTGRGMVVPSQGFVEVGTELQGTVRNVNVTPGVEVKRGSAVAGIRTGDGKDVTVSSPVEGTVATVLVRAGGVTDRGTALVTVEPASSEAVVVGFVPAGPGKRVQPGMDAQVAPESVPRSQYGTLKGKVTAVSPVPVPPERVILVVGGNASLADYFFTEGPILEVTVRLLDDPSTPSGYAWTTGDGPPGKVTLGTLASVEVVLSEEAPIVHILK